MGINMFEFKEVAQMYDVVADNLNKGWISMDRAQMNGFISAGDSIAQAMATGTMPGWLKWKLIKGNVVPHYKGLV